MQGTPRPVGLLQAHLRVAKPAVILLLAGLVAGPASSLLLRDWRPFGTLHGWFGLLAGLLFATGGWLGLRLHRGTLSRRRGANAHGLVGAIALLFGAVAAAAGLVLLP